MLIALHMHDIQILGLTAMGQFIVLLHKVHTCAQHLLFFYDIIIEQCVTMGSSSGSGTVYISLCGSQGNIYNFQNVSCFSNDYIGMISGALFITIANTENNVTLEHCVFHNNSNSSSGHGAALYVADNVCSYLKQFYVCTVSQQYNVQVFILLTTQLAIV